MSSATSPYAPPTARVDDVSESANPEAEAIRRAHIKHEASIRSVALVVAAFAIPMLANWTK
jgi:hypothetical protein